MNLRLRVHAEESHFNGLCSLSPIRVTNGYCIPQSLKLCSKSRVFLSFSSVLDRTQIESFVVCARSKRRRSSGHQSAARLLLKSLSLLTRNLQILPEPLDFVIAELGGGGDGGGGLGFRRGFGGSDGWRRKGKRISLSVFFWTILGFFGLCIISGSKKGDMILPVLGFLFFSIALAKQLKIRSKDLALGVFCIGASLFVGLKMEKKTFIKLAEEIRSRSSVRTLEKRKNKRVHRRV
ncbi:PREDICTED: uncharacterized protein LOC104802806 [Tarenaya hassleriana]|uniref:uncharacterized protein LOC104802806 n=1 Tax=Tarenaya hassleriana TaxID=28532 RepID=UPI00053C6D90|nr:PREDICTED: uncharacterized protein LOC104802806 [Tarenaya hassleriana]